MVCFKKGLPSAIAILFILKGLPAKAPLQVRKTDNKKKVML